MGNLKRDVKREKGKGKREKQKGKRKKEKGKRKKEKGKRKKGKGKTGKEKKGEITSKEHPYVFHQTNQVILQQKMAES